MNKRIRHKVAKKKLLAEQARARAVQILGRIFADEILHTMQRPSFVSGTNEDWLRWDNAQHPHWIRTSWGGKTKCLLRFDPTPDMDKQTLDKQHSR